jgi:hypothetical protein
VQTNMGPALAAELEHVRQLLTSLENEKRISTD